MASALPTTAFLKLSTLEKYLARFAAPIVHVAYGQCSPERFPSTPYTTLLGSAITEQVLSGNKKCAFPNPSEYVYHNVCIVLTGCIQNVPCTPISVPNLANISSKCKYSPRPCPAKIVQFTYRYEWQIFLSQVM